MDPSIVKAIKVAMAIMPKLLSVFRRMIPRRTLVLVVEERDCWWSIGGSSGQPAMQVSGHWHATNVSDQPIQILKARIVKPDIRGGVFVRHPQSDVYGDNVVPPQTTTEISTHFWIKPPTREKGQDLVARIEFTDQYGRRHRTPKTEFVGRVYGKPKQKVAREAMHSISDPIEKKVVAVLQAETDRYEQCGRGVGGLGSVQTRTGNQCVQGVGSDMPEANSPKQQEVLSQPVSKAVTSENVDALSSFYATLDATGRNTFEAALLNRLHRDGAYVSIGYFITLVLLRCGRFSIALSKARADLLGDSQYGFSDTLRLVDGLLKFEHNLFSDQNIDEIERFVDGVEESVFRIPQRLSAVRAVRLSMTKSGENLPNEM